MKLYIVLMLVVLTSCASQRALNHEKNIAEKYILRHGFTNLGHPSDQPIEYVELFDGLEENKAVLVKNRKGTLPIKSNCAVEDDGFVLVVFGKISDCSNTFMVYPDSTVKAVHSCIKKSYLKNTCV